MAKTVRNMPAVAGIVVRLREIDELFLEYFHEDEPEKEIAIPGVYQVVKLTLPGRYRYQGSHARGFLRRAAK